MKNRGRDNFNPLPKLLNCGEIIEANNNTMRIMVTHDLFPVSTTVVVRSWIDFFR
jgi:hypothetical protein